MSKEQTAPDVDWESIELEYRAGRKSLRAISAKYPGTNHVAIMRRAKSEGWTRNVAQRIQQKAEQMLVEAALPPEPEDDGQPVTEQKLVAYGAAKIFGIRTAHREHIERARKLVVKLMIELEMQSDNQDDFRKLGEMMFEPNEKGIDKLNEVYQKVIDLPQRIKGIKELGEALKNLIALEREAWGIEGVPPEEGDKDKPPQDLNDVARRVAFTLARAASSQPTVH